VSHDNAPTTIRFQRAGEQRRHGRPCARPLVRQRREGPAPRPDLRSWSVLLFASNLNLRNAEQAAISLTMSGTVSNDDGTVHGICQPMIVRPNSRLSAIADANLP
jgi:hypothetical protein